MLAVEGLAKDQPLLGALIGLGLLGLAWLSWTYFPRYESYLRRIPGVYGRLPTAIFLGVLGTVILGASLILAAT